MSRFKNRRSARIRNFLGQFGESQFFDPAWEALFDRLGISEDLRFEDAFTAAALQLIHQQSEFSERRGRGRPRKAMDIDLQRAICIQTFEELFPGWPIESALMMGRRKFPELFPLRSRRTITNSIRKGRKKLARLRTK